MYIRNTHQALVRATRAQASLAVEHIRRRDRRSHRVRARAVPAHRRRGDRVPLGRPARRDRGAVPRARQRARGQGGRAVGVQAAAADDVLVRARLAGGRDAAVGAGRRGGREGGV